MLQETGTTPLHAKPPPPTRHSPHAEVYSYNPPWKDPPLELPIYLNRTVRKLLDLTYIPATPRPKILLSPATIPLPLPPGAQLLAEQKIDGASWSAYLLPPSAPPFPRSH